MKPRTALCNAILASVLLILLLPIGIIARFVALDSRPNHAWVTFEKHDGRWFLMGDTDYTGDRWCYHHYWTDIDSGKHFGRSIQLTKCLDAGSNHDSIWVLKRDNTARNHVLEITSKFTDQHAKTFEVPILEPPTKKHEERRYVSNSKQAIVAHDRIDLYDLRTGSVVDSLPLSPLTKRTVIPLMFEANRFMLVEGNRPTGAVCKLIEIRDGKLIGTSVC